MCAVRTPLVVKVLRGPQTDGHGNGEVVKLHEAVGVYACVSTWWGHDNTGSRWGLQAAFLVDMAFDHSTARGSLDITRLMCEV